jgi:hypothetical protein
MSRVLWIRFSYVLVVVNIQKMSIFWSIPIVKHVLSTFDV